MWFKLIQSRWSRRSATVVKLAAGMKVQQCTVLFGQKHRHRYASQHQILVHKITARINIYSFLIIGIFFAIASQSSNTLRMYDFMKRISYTPSIGKSIHTSDRASISNRLTEKMNFIKFILWQNYDNNNHHHFLQPKKLKCTLTILMLYNQKLGWIEISCTHMDKK